MKNKQELLSVIIIISIILQLTVLPWQAASSLPQTFILYPSDNAGITDPNTGVINTNGTVTGAHTALVGGTALNGSNGTATIYIPAANTLNASGTAPCWGKPAVKLNGNYLNAAVTYTPASEGLNGVNTTVTYNGIASNGASSAQVSALISYNGGLTQTVVVYEEGASSGYNVGNLLPPKVIGTYANLEYVKIYYSSFKGGDAYLYSVKFETDSNPVVTPTPSASATPTMSPTPSPSVSPTPSPSVSPAASSSPVPSERTYITPLGLGASFALYPSDMNSISVSSGEFTIGEWGAIVNSPTDKSLRSGPFTIVDSAKFMNKNNGTAVINIAAGGNLVKSDDDAVFKKFDISVKGAEGTNVEYYPAPGLLTGVDANVYLEFQYFGTATKGLDAIVKYDGKTKIVEQTVKDGSTGGNNNLIEIPGGPFTSIESVTLKTRGTNEIFLPAVQFRVVNEHPGTTAPAVPKRTYSNPDISPAPASSVTPVPTPNIDSPLSINEVLAGNTKGVKDKKGSYSDWIELYNSSDTDINISGYGLTDNPGKPYKWAFPAGSFVPANSFLLVMASGNDTVTDGELHTNFSIAKEGETIMLSDAEGSILSVMDLPKLEDDVSMARIPDGSDNFRLCDPSPNISNNSAGVISVIVPKPEFSAESGFYENSFPLTLSSAGGTIYYTLDGSTPDLSKVSANGPTYVYLQQNPLSVVNRSNEPNVLSILKYDKLIDGKFTALGSPEFTPSVKVNKSMIIRALSVDGEGNKSDIVTKSFFVGLNIKTNYNNAAVLSMVTDKENLFSMDRGIWADLDVEDRERPAYLEMFERDGSLVINQNVGMSLHGFGYRGMDQRAVNFYARGEYGKGRFEHPIFEGKTSNLDGSPIESYNSFCIRHGSQNYKELRYLDGAMQLMSKDLGTGYQGQRPAVLFVNGEYWGVYYMCERVSRDYVATQYGVTKENMILIKNHTPRGVDEYPQLYDSDLKLYWDERKWLESTDFSIPANYAELERKYDIDNMMKFYASMLAMGNRDWIAFNFVQWRSRTVTDKPYEDGKWRFLMYDCDVSLEKPEDEAVLSNLNESWARAMYSNPSLRKVFLNCLCDVFSYTYEASKITDELKYWYDEYIPLLPEQEARWGKFSVQNALGNYYNSTIGRPPYYFDYLKQFFTTEGKYFKAYMKDVMKKQNDFDYFTGEYTHLNVKVNNAEYGSVKVNTITPDFTYGSYTGRYFTDIPSTLTAIPKEGYKFVGWTTSEGTVISSDTDISVDVTLSPNGSMVQGEFAPLVDIKGLGTESDPYQISNAEELLWVSGAVNSGNSGYSEKYYMLTSDIELAGETNFTAIGNKNIPFTGIFDGGFHTISGIAIEIGIQGQGLFGYVGRGGTVKNVGVINCNIVNGKNLGAIVGNNGGLVENCYSTGVLDGESTVGGIVGNNNGGIIKNCYSIADIYSISPNTLGGVAGKTESGGEVINCYSLIKPVGKNEWGTVDLLTSAKTAEEFANGTVTALLNGAGYIWETGDVSPVFAKAASTVLSFENNSIKIDTKTGLSKAKLIVAGYNGGVLTAIKISDITMAENTSDTVDIPDGISGEIRVMLLKDLDSAAPLAICISN